MKQIKGRFPVFHKAVFELKYEYGFTYLDRCGRIVNAIMKQDPAWVLSNTDPNPQSAPLINTANNCRFSFSTRKLDFSIEQAAGEEGLSDDDYRTLLNQIESITPVIISELSITEVTRIGFRVWYLFGCDNSQDSENWLRDLGCYIVPSKLPESFGGTLDATGFSAVIQSGDWNYRVAFNGVERSLPINLGGGILNITPHTLNKGQREFLIKKIKEKKRLDHNPRYAAMIDIDAYQELPKVIRPKEFVETSFEKGLECLTKAITSK